jgi:hypothetical protein
MMSPNKFRHRGQRLHPIIWQGSQWAVTTYGIEARDGTYAITKDRLSDPHWIDHMAEKEWVNIEDFAQALRLARGRYVRRC